MEISQATTRAPGQRLPRFTRVGADVLPFRIEERDLLAWRWIYDTRFMRTDHLRLLLPGSAQQITRRAQRWFHGGFVDRIRTGYAEWILAIANAGADEVCVRYDRDRGHINFDKKNQELKNVFFRAHTLSIGRFRVALELALRMKAAPEAAAFLAQWPVDQQQAAMAESLAMVQRQHHIHALVTCGNRGKGQAGYLGAFDPRHGAAVPTRKPAQHVADHTHDSTERTIPRCTSVVHR